MYVTKGEAVVIKRNQVVLRGTGQTLFDCENETLPIQETNSNAWIAAEAFNVYNTIGLTPYQIVDKLRKLDLL